ncbi:Vesicle trafficking protein Sly1 (Sec1 family) [Trachipleistophora hominis]|uniref:Vesicle trafficking protein Sly1 (Sec1 family) n=1 Tax=Trachipleistophora hominis TaxID=72359 RepID=L7JYD5_TRAHO|nr:Vesicle trafficking protein Sly1 (Sec1 family) [Trachipleistophora hominis]
MIQNLQKAKLSEFLKSSTWTVLILDDTTFPIINALFRFTELRRLNITTIFRLENTRENVTASAIYFVHSKNLHSIVSDVIARTYSSYNLNFIDCVSRDGLEMLAGTLSERRLALKVESVWDRHLNFLALDNNVFVVGGGVHEMAAGLFSLFFNLDNEPFIVSGDENVSGDKNVSGDESVAELLYKKMRNNLVRKKDRRPLLILFRRENDVITPLEHNWTYAGLINDVLSLNINTVKYTKDDRPCTYTITPDDTFYATNKYEKFPVVTERIEKEHLNYKKEIGKKNYDIAELNRSNEMIDAHMSICLNLINEISDRGYDEYYEMEQRNASDDQIYKMVEKGTVEDVKRFVCTLLRKGARPEVIEYIMAKRGITQQFVEHVVQRIKIEENTLLKRATNILSKIINVDTSTPLSVYVGEIVAKARKGELRVMGGRKVYYEEVAGVYVFVVGGGCYKEIDSLRRMDRDIVYGCGEILDGRRALERIESGMK